MAILIEDPETERIARELAALSGQTVNEVDHSAVSEQLQHFRIEEMKRAVADRINEITQRSAKHPVISNLPG